MAEKKAPAPRRSGMSVDPGLVRELADMLGETGLTEIEVEEGDRRIRVSRAGLVAAPAHAMAAPAAAPVAPAPDMSAPNASDAPGNSVQSAELANAVKSPMVGTAFLAPEPDSDNFVAVGDTVKKGDTLLIVEAMKVMNPITAPADGTVQQLLVGNGEPVEFDQPLIVIA
ncbi:acetyl-CoA carboxylase biotin carboxyl carrier protein [Aurantiacibacter marinus]|uniref:Biotin carboxyl carrier protein of acetyl-CoA carboxylase n=1 Tax=Aurantiacibacter marinus TaxID=874156 RepID=A0A0H0XMH2_9SPHN|nr:acetyl-CoA carboxylase biotin carboxyl carrier protein [Aurantiacibacter marinus]KLI63157.1 acetyl-CoA carboxylase [Aurantiacibacter marinus]